MDRAKSKRVALMSIHPQYAYKIMAGAKKVEFRKRRPAEDIVTIFVYATAPESKIIGQFHIGEVLEGTPQRIWCEFGELGGIEKDSFFNYYAGTPKAIAILVVDALRFDEPVPLKNITPRPPIPQSFIYLESEQVSSVLKYAY